MKKILNKPISFLLAIILLFLSIGIAPTVLAAGATTEIKFGEAEGKVGDEVTVPVTISNNPGISIFFFVVKYDVEGLTFVSADEGEILTSGTFTPVNDSVNGELSLPWFTVDGDIAEDGVLMNLTFRINESAKGDFELTVRYLPQDIANAMSTQVDCNVMNGKISTGSTVKGTITSFGEATEPVTLRLLENGTEIDKVTSTDGTYSFSSVSPGTYTIEVSKINHATRTYEITVEREDITEALKIHLKGDIDGNGRVNTTDVNRAFAHVRKTNFLTGYELTCADVIGTDGKVNTTDVNRIFAHVRKTNLLW
jgi:hypothetical protein